MGELKKAEWDAIVCVQLDGYKTSKYTLRLVQIFERTDQLIDALEAINNCFGADEQLTSKMTAFLQKIDKDPEQTNIFRLLKQIKDEPTENWTELVVLSRYNDIKVPKHDFTAIQTGEGGTYANGFVLEKRSYGYKWTGMTMIEGQQVWNFKAKFDPNGNFTKGYINSDYYGKKLAMDKR